MKKRLLLVPSTHWDREWYKPQSEFSVYLTELFELVLEKLESGELGNYFTDGQAVMVEDILNLKPEWRERMAKFASKGKLELGPFYVLTDMYMPSGESFFRNIAYGIEIINQLGGKPGIPYAPDAFGHNQDLPAILNSAGFDAYFFCRGIGEQLDPPRSEFIWKDKNDLYKILALSAIVDIFHPVTGRWISGAYGLGMNLPQKQEEFQERLEVIWSYLEKYSDLPIQLAMNGSDHLLPEENLASRLEKFNQANVGFTAETAPIAEYVREAWNNLDTDKLPSVSGELIAGKFFKILTGTSSSRVNLKIRNAMSQYLLEKLAEPSLAVADAKLRERYQTHLDNAWKWLLQNQAHDSICGCSVDAVHREMGVRFDKIECSMTVVAERLLRLTSGVEDLRAFMPAPDAEVIKLAALSNAYGMSKGNLKRLNFVIPDNIDLAEYGLFDNDNNEYDFIAADDKKCSTTNGPFIPAGPQGRLCSRINVYTDMPFADGFSRTSLFLRRKEKAVSSDDSKKLPVSCENGKLVLNTPLYRIEDFLSLIDTADIGDEYDFRPAENPEFRINTKWQELERKTVGNIYQASFKTSVVLPEKYDSENNVELPVVLQITGTFADDSFAADIFVNNNAKDHRLQLRIKTPFEFTQYCRESQFNHIITDVERMVEPDTWRDKTEPLRRNFGHVSVTSNGKDFAFMPLGLHEHTTDGKSFDLTLIRAVGNLGQSGAGPHIDTPEAQIQGEIKLSVAFSWQGYGANSNTLWKKSNRLLNPACGVVLHPDIESRTYCENYVNFESDKLLVSAFTFDKSLNKNIIRIFNPSNEDASGKLSGMNIPAILNKLEYKYGSVSEISGKISADNITLKAGEIATFCC